MTGVKYTGVLSPEELASLPGIPSTERIERGSVAVVECAQQIPCNPCVDACVRQAISINGSITGLPELDGEKCNGCGVCITRCPGLAIFTVHKNYTDTTSLLSFPYEYLPLPETGSRVRMAGRDGGFLCDGTVRRVLTGEKLDKTAVVTVELPKAYCMEARTLCKKPETRREPDESEIYVCRCEEVTLADIKKAVLDGAKTFTAVKTCTNAGMGVCQGMTCRKNIEKLIDELLPGNENKRSSYRFPVRLVSIGELVVDEEREGGSV